MGPELSDGEVIWRSLGDPSAFRGVFERHHGAIFSYAARRVGTDAAADIAADVFEIALDRRDGYDTSIADAGPWLYGIAANLVRRYWRKQARGARAYRRAASTLSVGSFTDDANRRVDAIRAVNELQPALSKLRDKDREVLFLYALTDLNYEQVARAMRIPVGTVRSSLSRTRKAVRNHLTEFGQDRAKGNTPPGVDE